MTMHLTDCFIEVVAYVAYFLRSVEKKQPPYDQVRADVLRLLSQSQSGLKDGQIAQEDYDSAHFAICAWVDEAILHSPWHAKGQWQREQLQRLFYQTTEAGEEFFERLNRVGLHQREVREIYYLCLAMGFQGRYCHEGDDYLIDQLKTSNLKLLLAASLGIPSLDRVELFPEAYPPEGMTVGAPSRQFQFSALTISCLAAPIFLFGLLFWIYRFVLTGVSSSFLKVVG
jgi:type VI secretion system protein ImpK